MSKKTLYICYFGLREPLVQTQVLPYLRQITKGGIGIDLLTFENSSSRNWSSAEIESQKQELFEEGIHWHFLRYHKSPALFATLYDVLRGAFFVFNLSRREKIDFLHARAHIPMLIAMVASKFSSRKLVFDIRGLMAEEYADAGVWKDGSIPFRLIKYVENKGIEKATQIVVLTNRMKNYLLENKKTKKEKIEVIPCCVDFSRVDMGSKSSKKAERFELIYAGTVTGLYLLKEMGMFFVELRKHKHDAFFRILTTSPPSFVAEVFNKLGIDSENYEVTKVDAESVPEYLKRAHLGISFRLPTFSQIAASPTKIPEYLACGIPVVSNSGVGDIDALFENETVGYNLVSIDSAEITVAAEAILEILNRDGLSEKCAAIAKRNFDLSEVGGERYRNVYRKMQENSTESTNS